MKKNPEEIISGVVRYADQEVIPKLNGPGKWIVGTLVGMSSNRMAQMARQLQDNALIRMIGVVDEDGLYDIDDIADHLGVAAQKYGYLTLEVPLIGTLTFKDEDVHQLRRYIKGEL